MRETNTESLNLENWYATSQGSFMFMREKRLLQRLLSCWPRRGHSLLEVECGTGLFLDFFWEGGFDVTGLDSQPAFVDLARSRMNGKAEVQIASPDALPFHDNEFDYVALIHVLENSKQASNILAEAQRVAAKGVVIAFINPWSLGYMGHALSACLPWKKRVSPWNCQQHFSAWNYYKMARSTVRPKAFSLRSTLLGPQWTWGKRFACLNALTLPLPFGSLAMVRIDHGPQHAGTGMPLRLKPVGLKNLSPVRIMERSHKEGR